jgi:hypothetical protein
MQVMPKGPVFEGFCWLDNLNLGSYNRVPIVTTETKVVVSIRQHPLAIASTCMAFTKAFEQNLKNILHELEKHKEKIRKLEEELQFYKEDQTSIKEFKKCVESVRHELHNLAKNMYKGLQVFYKKRCSNQGEIRQSSS